MAALFVISYDLMAPGKNYEPLWAELRRLQARPVLLSQWAGRIEATSAQLRDHLRQFMDANDRILVINTEGAKDWAAFNILTRMDQM